MWRFMPFGGVLFCVGLALWGPERARFAAWIAAAGLLVVQLGAMFPELWMPAQ